MNYMEKFKTCRLLGFPKCPNVKRMKTLFFEETTTGKPKEYFGIEDEEEDAKLCEDCDKYEKNR